MNYPDLDPGYSIGLVPDGNLDYRQTLDFPTPATPNRLPTQSLPVVINEWMAANDRTLADPADGDFIA